MIDINVDISFAFFYFNYRPTTIAIDRASKPLLDL